MNLPTLLRLTLNGQIPFLLEMNKIYHQFYRACFIAAALENGIYAQLRQAPASLETLNQALGSRLEPAILEAWLEMGVSLGELKRTPRGYILHSRLSKRLAQPENDPSQALLQETVHLHHAMLTQTPERLRQKRHFTLADTDGELIARSSRILEPFVFAAVDAAIAGLDSTPDPILLEVGCGSGVYIRHACQRCPALTAQGLELLPQVAEIARQNMSAWGLSGRVSIDSGDIRSYQTERRFDLITLHNNIYYFAPEERAALARRLGGYLKPGGRLLITTGCQGGGPNMQMLNLWALLTEGAGALPKPDEMVDQLREAGFRQVQTKNLMAGDSFYSFVGGDVG